MITEETRLALSDDVARRAMGGGRETVTLSLKNGHVYTCSDKTARLVRAVDGHRRLKDIVEMLQGDYSITRERLTAELLTLTKRLLAEGLVVVLPDADAAPADEDEA